MASLLRRTFVNNFKMGGVSRSFGVESFYQGGFLDPNATAQEKYINARSGDAWPAALLRRKSFDDLRKLYFVLLKEKHFLMTERNAFFQYNASQPLRGRYKKVRLSIKRLLTVLSQREIHQQCLTAKHIAEKQKEREELETRRFELEESIKNLRFKLLRLDTVSSVSRLSWRRLLSSQEEEHQKILQQLKPLRIETIKLLTPDWRRHKKYSDLPGRIRWNPLFVRALRDMHAKPVRYY